ncbi:unnamed protein product [Adineta ricciae]|uniref:FAD/NAD(P)-binding domain-containing protein n=1 Tax=Adineta ricciae TaxID=249248 RepID=A0A814WTA7_ADIRI|nr:unnamed protein product [Adineta ricciae]CAF1208363.1 unnamed protein product [Adineta ricciae]
MKKIVVIGAGQIGRETACQVAEMGYDVDIINRCTNESQAASSADQAGARAIIDKNSLKVVELLNARMTGKLTFKKYANEEELGVLLCEANFVAVCVGRTLNSMSNESKGIPHPLQGAVENSNIYEAIGKAIAENAADDVRVLSTAIPVEVVANTLYSSIKKNWSKSIERKTEFHAGRICAGGTLLDTIRLKNVVLDYINAKEERATEIIDVYALGSHGYGPYSDQYEIGLMASTHCGSIRFGGVRRLDGTWTDGDLIPFDQIINYAEKQTLMKAAFTQPVYIRDAAGERALHKEAGRSNAVVIKAFLQPELFQGMKLSLAVFSKDKQLFYGGVCTMTESGLFEEIPPSTYLSSQEQEVFNVRIRGIQKVNDAIKTTAPGTSLDTIVALGKQLDLQPQQLIGFI